MAVPAVVAVVALPVILIPHVPLAFAPVVLGAPMVLNEMFFVAEPLNDEFAASPAPALLKTTLYAVAFAVVAVVAVAAFPPIFKDVAVPV